ncbi:MAG TPA: hypothetical protein VL134_00140 [Leptolyngbya sp.]|nr:hypothetical protein [Leptolyngbya sp.]
MQNKIDCWVYRFAGMDWQPSSEVYTRIEKFSRQSAFDVLLVVHPEVEAMNFIELKELITALNQQVADLGLGAFGGHPDDLFEIQGVRTRQDPFINFTVQKSDKLAKARETLKTTAYYDRWTNDAFAAIDLSERLSQSQS